MPGNSRSGQEREVEGEVTRFADDAKFMQNIKEGI